jgi:hypothetical protein
MNQIGMHFCRQSFHLLAARASNDSLDVCPVGWERKGGRLPAFAECVVFGQQLS